MKYTVYRIQVVEIPDEIQRAFDHEGNGMGPEDFIGENYVDYFADDHLHRDGYGARIDDETVIVEEYDEDELIDITAEVLNG